MLTHLGLCFLSLLFATEIAVAQIRNDDLSVVRQRVLDWMLLPSKENLTSVVESATAYARSLNGSCYWSDVMYNDTRLTHWRTVEHLVRTTMMLQAITATGSTVHNDSRIRAAIHCALNVWLVNDWQALNWFHNEINVPTYLTGQLLMLDNDATRFEIEKIQQISFRSAWWLNRPRDVGANRAWMIQIQLYRSLATKNMTGLEQGFTRMWNDVAVQSIGNVGIQYDWSYHFHGTQLLSGAYGQAWAQTILGFVACSDQTKYGPSQEQLSTFVQFLTNGSAWMIVGRDWDWNVIGRAVSRPDKEYRVALDTRFIRIVAELLNNIETRTQLVNLADRLSGQSNASALTGNKHFFASDYHVHRRPNWISAIKMQSVRTQSIECINVEDQKGEHSGQGVLNLYTGEAYPYDDIFPLLDWQALNGITVEHDIPLEPCVGGVFAWQNATFVGGVSDDQYGLAMMETVSHNLTAKRSWHFYDEAIIALATNLTLPTTTAAWTTLASRLLPSGNITVGFWNSTMIHLSDGNHRFPYSEDRPGNVQWIHVGTSNIGYLLPLQQRYASIGIELMNRTENYLSIGSFNQTVTGRVLTIWINHGVGPYTLDYNYMILPDVSLESMPARIRQFEEEQLFACISTNARYHGVAWPALRRASFVLWDDVTTTFSCTGPSFHLNIEVSDAGAYLFSETPAGFTLWASHPTRTGGRVKVSVDRAGSGQACSTVETDGSKRTKVTLQLPSTKDLLGASVSTECKITSGGMTLRILSYLLLLLLPSLLCL